MDKEVKTQPQVNMLEDITDVCRVLSEQEMKCIRGGATCLVGTCEGPIAGEIYFWGTKLIKYSDGSVARVP